MELVLVWLGDKLRESRLPENNDEGVVEGVGGILETVLESAFDFEKDFRRVRVFERLGESISEFDPLWSLVPEAYVAVTEEDSVTVKLFSFTDNVSVALEDAVLDGVLVSAGVTVPLHVYVDVLSV